MILQLAHGEGDSDQRLEAYAARRLGHDPLNLHSVPKRNFDRLAQISFEADAALSCILGKRGRYFGERLSTVIAADLDDVINANVYLCHGGRIKKSKAFAVMFSETTMDG